MKGQAQRFPLLKTAEALSTLSPLIGQGPCCRVSGLLPHGSVWSRPQFPAVSLLRGITTAVSSRLTAGSPTPIYKPF